MIHPIPSRPVPSHCKSIHHLHTESASFMGWDGWGCAYGLGWDGMFEVRDGGVGGASVPLSSIGPLQPASQPASERRMKRFHFH